VNPSQFTGDSNRPVEAQLPDAATVPRSRRASAAGRVPPGYAYRLPTGPWEHACRAGTTNRFSFATIPPSPGFCVIPNSDTTRGGVKWGLHDMRTYGVVWDWFAPYSDARRSRRAGRSKFKVFRGGGWNQEVQFARSGNRFMMSPSTASFGLPRGAWSGPAPAQTCSPAMNLEGEAVAEPVPRAFDSAKRGSRHPTKNGGTSEEAANGRTAW
jgi:formylglycine-generating enzyme required for sulfatase activity